MKLKKSLFAMLAALILLVFTACSGKESSSSKGGSSTSDDSVIKLGMSLPLSGAAANYGITADWVAKQAVKMINEQGGVTADGKNYKFEVISYDNKYDATTGTEVAQTLIHKDKVDFLVGTVGTAPTLALQAIAEKEKIIMFNGSWATDIKGLDYPYTFTTVSTPVEVLGPFYSYIIEKHPDVKKVAMINPNDASGFDTAKAVKKEWEGKGLKIVSDEYYERGSTEFSSIATKILKDDPDIVDLGVTPPGEGGLILQALAEQGWDGVKVNAAGTSAEQVVEIAGDAAEGVYFGVAPDFTGKNATDVQKDLAKRAADEINETLSAISVQPWDAIMALKQAIEKTGTLDAEKIIDVLPTLVVDSSYGPAVFGSEDFYGSPQQLLVPITVTQVQDGKGVEVSRVISKELEEKLAEMQ